MQQIFATCQILLALRTQQGMSHNAPGKRMAESEWLVERRRVRGGAAGYLDPCKLLPSPVSSRFNSWLHNFLTW